MLEVSFLTFGGPSSNYHAAVKRICTQAADLRLFRHIIGKTDADLKADTDFWTRHGAFVEENARGYGYWLWKSYLVKRQLELMNDADILVYADAGCVVNAAGVPRLIEYFKLARQSPNGIVSFQMDHLECAYTKMDVFDHFDAHDLKNTGQLMATIFIVRKCPESVALITRWYESCCNYRLISDEPSSAKNDARFVAHRHDQSVWSILRKQSGGILLPDETWHGPTWVGGKKYPILAMRVRG